MAVEGTIFFGPCQCNPCFGIADSGIVRLVVDQFYRTDFALEGNAVDPAKFEVYPIITQALNVTVTSIEEQPPGGFVLPLAKRWRIYFEGSIPSSGQWISSAGADTLILIGGSTRPAGYHFYEAGTSVSGYATAVQNGLGAGQPRPEGGYRASFIQIALSGATIPPFPPLPTSPA